MEASDVEWWSVAVCGWGHGPHLTSFLTTISSRIGHLALYY